MYGVRPRGHPSLLLDGLGDLAGRDNGRIRKRSLARKSIPRGLSKPRRLNTGKGRSNPKRPEAFTRD